MRFINLNKKARIGFFQIFLILLSVFAFSWILSHGFPLVGAEVITRQLYDGTPIQVVRQGDGTFVAGDGVVYEERQDGRLEKRKIDYVSSELVSPVSASATQNPANFPAGLSSARDDSIDPAVLQSMMAGGAAAPIGAGTDSTQMLLGSLGQLGGLLKGPLGEALIWGGVLFGAAMAVSSVLGAKQEMVQAISIAVGVGAFSAKIAEGVFGVGLFPSILIGAGIGFAIFMLIYEETKYEAVTFQCMPWQAPIGATRTICETCNDPTRPCSEYRCKSLGQTCELVNKGTDKEMCVNVDIKDVKPPVISPNPNELTIGYEYTNVRLSPPGPGFDIIRSVPESPCVQPFTPLRFGVTTNKPSQCRIDFESTTSFDAMRSFMGGSNLFQYQHYEQLVLPHPDYFGNTTFALRHGEDMTFYIRCIDKMGNYNEAEYAVNFCVDSSPDTTPPVIRMTSVDDGGCIPATTDSAMVEFYVNKPSQCRWSYSDQDYDLMPYNMVCSSHVFEMNALQLYTCQANLTGITRDLTRFYIRCQDYQDKPVNDRNTNQESLFFSLRGSNMLKLRELGPNGTIFGGVSPMLVELRVETLFGCDFGRANCYFSDRVDSDYILFADTNNEDGIHTQKLYLTGGSHEYFIKCIDSGGNMIVESTEFFLDIDTASPIIARIYNDAGQLKIVTLRDSECTYSHENCDFLIEEGINMPIDDTKVHFADWDNKKTYYIKCRDRFRDLTADCSAIVRPIRLFYE